MRYSHYKPTGIPWLPEVPSEWAVRRLKYVITSLRKGNGITKDDVYEDGDLPCIRYGEIYSKYDVSFDKCLSATRKSLVVKPQYVQKGDILFSCTGELVDEIGKNIVYHGSEPCVAGGDIIVISHAQNPRYLNYYLNSYPAQRQKSYGKAKLKVVHLHTLDVQNIVTLLPSECEQRAIVAFLDEKCGKVNRLVAAKEKEVALLKELKQSIVSECVTSGLAHKDLIVPTGVFWQPMMPEGWSVRKCRHALRKLNRPRPQGAELLVCTNKGTVNKRGDAKIGLVSDDETIYQGVAKGDLLIHGMDTWHGAIAVSKFDGMCTPVVHVCDSSESKEFVAYCFQNMARGRLFKLISNGVRQNTSDFRSWEKVAQLPLILPPLAEQREIVAYIEAKFEKIDAAAAGLEKEIAALKEYKQRLIADVVTGQRRVA